MNFLRGFATTIKHLFEEPVTVQFPEQERPVRERFKGRHALKRYDNGLEKCIGCSLCAAACPADAIWVEAAENTRRRAVTALANGTRKRMKSTCFAASFVDTAKTLAQRKRLCWSMSTG